MQLDIVAADLVTTDIGAYYPNTHINAGSRDIGAGTIVGTGDSWWLIVGTTDIACNRLLAGYSGLNELDIVAIAGYLSTYPC